MDEVLLEVIGANGRLRLFKNVVRIQRFGTFPIFGRAGGVEQDIVITQIKGIRFGRAGVISNGYIEFDFDQDQAGADSPSLNAGSRITFRPGQQRAFESFRTALEERIHPASARSPGPVTTELDELAKLASLRDRKIITQDEFDRKKKQLLGL